MPVLAERRRLQRAYAAAEGYFWLPCPVCGEEFGGHEWVTDGELPGEVPDPERSGVSTGICPSCTRDGYGYPMETFGWFSAVGGLRGGQTVQLGARTMTRTRELTDRQVEVCQLIADGYSLRYIGARLGISEYTVAGHKRKAMERLGAHTTAELVAKCFRLSIIK